MSENPIARLNLTHDVSAPRLTIGEQGRSGKHPECRAQLSDHFRKVIPSDSLRLALVRVVEGPIGVLSLQSQWFVEKHLQDW